MKKRFLSVVIIAALILPMLNITSIVVQARELEAVTQIIEFNRIRYTNDNVANYLVDQIKLADESRMKELHEQIVEQYEKANSMWAKLGTYAASGLEAMSKALSESEDPEAQVAGKVASGASKVLGMYIPKEPTAYTMYQSLHAGLLDVEASIEKLKGEMAQYTVSLAEYTTVLDEWSYCSDKFSEFQFSGNDFTHETYGYEELKSKLWANYESIVNMGEIFPQKKERLDQTLKLISESENGKSGLPREENILLADDLRLYFDALFAQAAFDEKLYSLIMRDDDSIEDIFYKSMMLRAELEMQSGNDKEQAIKKAAMESASFAFDLLNTYEFMQTCRAICHNYQLIYMTEHSTEDEPDMTYDTRNLNTAVSYYSIVGGANEDSWYDKAIQSNKEVRARIAAYIAKVLAINESFVYMPNENSGDACITVPYHKVYTQEEYDETYTRTGNTNESAITKYTPTYGPDMASEPRYVLKNNKVSKGNVLRLNKFPDWMSNVFRDEEFTFSVDEESEDNATITENGLLTVTGEEGSITAYLNCNGIPVYSLQFEIVPQKFNGGMGTDGFPYLISNAGDLINMKNADEECLHKWFALTNDINMEGAWFRPIDNFYGIFDGKGYSLYGLNITENATYEWFNDHHYEFGLIRKNSGIIRNMTFCSVGITLNIGPKDDDIHNEDNNQLDYGIVCGINEANGRIYNVEILNSDMCLNYDSGNDNWIDVYSGLGGICGSNKGLIRNCEANHLDIESNTRVMQGCNHVIYDPLYDVHLTSGSCYGTIYSSTGGICGKQESDSGVIKDCYVHEYTAKNISTVNVFEEDKDDKLFEDVVLHSGGIVGTASRGIVTRALDLSDPTKSKSEIYDLQGKKINPDDIPEWGLGGDITCEAIVKVGCAAGEITDLYTDEAAMPREDMEKYGWRYFDKGNLNTNRSEKSSLALFSSFDHLKRVTQTTVEFENIPFLEYAIISADEANGENGLGYREDPAFKDKLSWQKESEFENLVPGTVYYVFARYPDRGCMIAGDMSVPVKVVTLDPSSVTYINRWGEYPQSVYAKDKAIDISNWIVPAFWNDGWCYVVRDEDVVTNRRILVTGNARLVLPEGTTFHALGGISVSKGSRLDICSTSEYEAGTLEAIGTENESGIGGEPSVRLEPSAAGIIAIHDGTVIAQGGNNAAGIGGSNYCDGGELIVYYGTVTAQGGNNAAGIGGGYYGDAGDVKIYGGTVEATGGDCDTIDSEYGSPGIGNGSHGMGGNVDIYGGTVVAEGTINAPGITCESKPETEYLGTVSICGGNITAIGGSHAAGIGGREYFDCGNLDISGGTIKAIGGVYGAGIGGGYKANGGNVDISGGDIEAIGGHGAQGIGGGAQGSKMGTITPKTSVYLTAGKDSESAKQVTLEDYAYDWLPYLHIATEMPDDYKVSYMDRSFDDEEQIYVYKSKETTCTMLSSGDDTNLNSGTYYVENPTGNKVDFDRLKINGDVKLIIPDNTEVDVARIEINGADGHLRIYSQSIDEDMGVLKIHPQYVSAISGERMSIYGGKIDIENYHEAGWDLKHLDVYGGKISVTNVKDVDFSNKINVIGTGYSIKVGNESRFIYQLDGRDVAFDMETYPDPVVYGSAELNEKTGEYNAIDKKIDSYMTLDSQITTSTLNSGWYIVEDNVDMYNFVKINGEVNIILADGSKLYADQGFNVTSGNTLNIYAQSRDNTGILEARGYWGAGIGTRSGKILNEAECGNVNIYGGKVIATGYDGAAGVGGGEDGAGGNVTIYGGELIAQGGNGDTLAIGAGVGKKADNNGSIDIKVPYTLLTSQDTKVITLDEYINNPTRDAHIITSIVYSGQPYIFKEYNEDEDKVVSKIEHTELLTEITNDYKPTQLTDEWYCVSGDDVEYTEPINISGTDVNIILANGAKLNAKAGILVPDGTTLNIYAQSEGDSMGTIIAAGIEGSSGIGGNEQVGIGSVNIYGGNINSTGGEWGAGIGGSEGQEGGSVTVFGGNIVATGGEWGAGIGGTDGNVTIYDGTVKAYGKSGGAGIGGSYYEGPAKVAIYGGNVIAQCEPASIWEGVYEWGEAIGCGATIPHITSVPKINDSCLIFVRDDRQDATHKYEQHDTNDIAYYPFVHIYKPENVSYISRSWNETTNKVVSETITTDEYNEITNDTVTWADIYDGIDELGHLIVIGRENRLTLGADYGGDVSDKYQYYVKEDVNVDSISVRGDVQLILADDVKLTTGTIIISDDGSSLTVCSQSDDEKMGELYVENTQYYKCAIGPAEGNLFNFNVCGGDITVISGKEDMAAIGNGIANRSFNMTVYGGNITAIGGENAVGIGGSLGDMGGDIKLYGGCITAQGGKNSFDIGRGYDTSQYAGSILVTPYVSLKASRLGSQPVNHKGENVYLNTFDTSGGKVLFVNNEKFPYTEHIGEKMLYVYLSDNDETTFDTSDNKLELSLSGNEYNVSVIGEDRNGGMVIVALYDSENMENLLDLKAFDLEKAEVPTGEFSQSGYVQAMWWASLDDVMPVCGAVGKMTK